MNYKEAGRLEDLRGGFCGIVPLLRVSMAIAGSGGRAGGRAAERGARGVCPGGGFQVGRGCARQVRRAESAGVGENTVFLHLRLRLRFQRTCEKRGSVSSSGAPAKRPHAKRALAENGDLRGHEELGLHIRSPKKLISLVDTHMEMTAFDWRSDWRAQRRSAMPVGG